MTRPRQPSAWQALLDGFKAIGEGLAVVFSFGLYQPPRLQYRRRYLPRKSIEETLADDYRRVEKDMEKVLKRTGTGGNHE